MASRARHVFLTGYPGVGKTTAALATVAALAEATGDDAVADDVHHRRGSRPARPGGRVGFDVVTLPLDHSSPPRASGDLACPSSSTAAPRVGRYAVDVASFESLARRDHHRAGRRNREATRRRRRRVQEAFFSSMTPRRRALQPARPASDRHRHDTRREQGFRRGGDSRRPDRRRPRGDFRVLLHAVDPPPAVRTRSSPLPANQSARPGRSAPDLGTRLQHPDRGSSTPAARAVPRARRVANASEPPRAASRNAAPNASAAADLAAGRGSNSARSLAARSSATIQPRPLADSS